MGEGVNSGQVRGVPKGLVGLTDRVLAEALQTMKGLRWVPWCLFFLSLLFVHQLLALSLLQAAWHTVNMLLMG
jgi:hypothetical protein